MTFGGGMSNKSQLIGLWPSKNWVKGCWEAIRGLKAVRAAMSIFAILCSIMQAKLRMPVRRLINTFNCLMT